MSEQNAVHSSVAEGTEGGSDQVAVDQSEPSKKEVIDYSILMKRFNQNMLGVSGLGLAFIILQIGQQAILPFILGSVLVWLNMLMLAKGLSGVLNGERSLVGLLLIKFGILIGGVYSLGLLFPEQRFALILGCSTWVLAMIMMGQVKTTSKPVLFILLAVSLLSTLPAEAKITEAEMLEGEVAITVIKVPKSPMPKIIAEGIIKAKARDLWSVIADCANFKHTMSNIADSKVVGYFKGLKRCEMVVDLPFPLSNLRSVVDVTLKEEKKVFTRSWKLVEGDYHKNAGEWKLTARPDGYTFLKYTVHVEPKISIPDFIQRAAQKSKIPGMYEDLSDLMKKRGKLLP